MECSLPPSCIVKRKVEVMRVLLVPSPPALGDKITSGVGRYLSELVRAMGNRVEYIFLDNFVGKAPANPEVPEIAGPQKVGRDLAFRLVGGYVRDALRLARQISPYRKKVDLIHVNNVGCETHTIAAKLAGFRKVVTTVHNLPGEDRKARHGFRRLIERLSFACGDLHIVPSEMTFEAWQDRVGLPREKIARICHGIVPADIFGFNRDEWRQRFCRDSDQTILIGVCARLHYMKGHTVLLEAFKKLLQERTGRCKVDSRKHQPLQDQQLMLLIAGEGPERPNIEAKIRELGISEHVRMLGHVDNAFGFQASLDINVLPSFSESMGFSVIEAMFAGVPSVVTDACGASELVTASGGGQVVARGDAHAIATGIGYYIKNPGIARADGERARRFAEANLTSDRMAEATYEVYERVMAG